MQNSNIPPDYSFIFSITSHLQVLKKKDGKKRKKRRSVPEQLVYILMSTATLSTVFTSTEITSTVFTSTDIWSTPTFRLQTFGLHRYLVYTDISSTSIIGLHRHLVYTTFTVSYSARPKELTTR
jgi:hypothetical protein